MSWSSVSSLEPSESESNGESSLLFNAGGMLCCIDRADGVGAVFGASGMMLSLLIVTEGGDASEDSICSNRSGSIWLLESVAILSRPSGKATYALVGNCSDFGTGSDVAGAHSRRHSRLD